MSARLVRAECNENSRKYHWVECSEQANGNCKQTITSNNNKPRAVWDVVKKITQLDLNKSRHVIRFDTPCTSHYKKKCNVLISLQANISRNGILIMPTSLTHFRTDVAALIFLTASDYLAPMQDYTRKNSVVEVLNKENDRRNDFLLRSRLTCIVLCIVDCLIFALSDSTTRNSIMLIPDSMIMKICFSTNYDTLPVTLNFFFVLLQS